MNNIQIKTGLSIVMLSLLLLPGLKTWAQSYDGLWSIIDVDHTIFPEDFSPPSEFLSLTLDAALLEQIVANAPPERFEQTPTGVIISVPLPDGQFAEANVSTTLLMERTLAEQFPQIKTYVFYDEFSGVSGHMAHGPTGFYLAAVENGQLIRIEPVETTLGTIYLSYFDHHRTDGANDDTTIHPPTAGDGGPDPVPIAASSHNHAGHSHDHKLQIVAKDTPVSGDQLRIYRLATATTAEFYQARGGNDLSVLFSLIVDVLGTNAVFETEVATRLIISAASLDLFYDDPNTAPYFNAPPQCSLGGVPNGNACTSNDDCDTDNGEICNIRTTCQLRDDNRNNLIALHNANTVTHDQYDLSVLFAVSRPGVRGGCAWYVVCLEGNTNHKARGMVTATGGGTGSTSGVLAHEGGHMLGARHTFTGQDGACTLNEFLAGDSESGYEPGSGTTRMSYAGNCGTDNVDTSNDPPADQYFHSRSIDEIVENVFSGDGANCGALVNTGNQAPSVNAGPDYAIPRQTPFTLTPASHSDQQPLTFNWEQYDRAFFPRPIDTDFISIFGIPDFGPIIRSVPPSSDPTRTVPNLADLLDGTSHPPTSTNRAGEMLPQVDRELNFRFIARDEQMGGGGVAYDTMTITVEGDPFFLTSPNGGEQLNAGCIADATWEVGGSNTPPVSTANVDLLFSEDGGWDFSPLLASIANDGEQAFGLPCTDTNTARLKAQGTDNIFFDISDGDFEVEENAPVIASSTTDGEVDAQCEFTAIYEATVTDDCGLAANDVIVTSISETTGNAELGTPVINTTQVDDRTVDLSASVLVSNLTGSPALVQFDLSATDNCGLISNDSVVASVSDTTPPSIEIALSPDTLWPPNHKMIDITATVEVADNCDDNVEFVLDSVVSDEPDDTTGDGRFINDIQEVAEGTPDQSFLLRAERMGNNDGRTYTATYTATDDSNNSTSDSATVEVPHNQ